MYVYCTAGMSIDHLDEPLTELFVYSPKADMALVELMTVCASYHRNKLPLGIHHTVNIWQPWLEDSKCDHGFISLPYLDGEDLEIFNFEGNVIRCLLDIDLFEVSVVSFPAYADTSAALRSAPVEVRSQIENRNVPIPPVVEICTTNADHRQRLTLRHRLLAMPS